MADDLPPVIYLMGPTASGKTDVAAALYERFPVELISVDAAQVYRGMDIGTAKPDATFLGRYPHHLIDIRWPSDTYSAADFAKDARELIDDIHMRNKVPLLVGGTMFYFKALESGLSTLPVTDIEVRNAAHREILEKGLDAVYQQLQSLDPDTAKRIAPNDRQRVQRAMEIYQLSGKAPSTLMNTADALPYPLIKLTLFDTDRAALHNRIYQRFHAMIDQGLVDEVERVSRDLTGSIDSLPSMRTVGYRQVYDFLQGKIDFGLMIEKAVAATRQLAKRQLTWLRQQSNVVWFQTCQRQSYRAQAIGDYLNHHPRMPQ